MKDTVRLRQSVKEKLIAFGDDANDAILKLLQDNRELKQKLAIFESLPQKQAGSFQQASDWKGGAPAPTAIFDEAYWKRLRATFDSAFDAVRRG